MLLAALPRHRIGHLHTKATTHIYTDPYLKRNEQKESMHHFYNTLSFLTTRALVLRSLPTARHLWAGLKRTNFSSRTPLKARRALVCNCHSPLYSFRRACQRNMSLSSKIGITSYKLLLLFPRALQTMFVQVPSKLIIIEHV